jgi:hypothetical protein
MFRLKKCLVIGQPLVRDKCLLGLSSPVISDQQKRCFNRAFLIGQYNQKKDFLKSREFHSFTFVSQILHSYFIFKIHLNSAFSCPRFVLVSFNVICLFNVLFLFRQETASWCWPSWSLCQRRNRSGNLQIAWHSSFNSVSLIPSLI